MDCNLVLSLILQALKDKESFHKNNQKEKAKSKMERMKKTIIILIWTAKKKSFKNKKVLATSTTLIIRVA